MRLRPWSIAVVLCASNLSWAQEEAKEDAKEPAAPLKEFDPAAAEKARQEQTAKPAEAPRPPPITVPRGVQESMHDHGQPPPPGASDQEQVLARARQFFDDLLLADARNAVSGAAFPFFLEGQRFDDPDALQLELLKHVRAKRTDLLVLYGIEVLTPAEMEQRFGKRPDRLANLPLKDKGTYVAVANLSGHAAVAICRPAGNTFRVIAYHD